MNINTHRWLKTAKTILLWIGIIVGAIVLLAILVVIGARLITYCTNHISEKTGIDEGIYVPLGGQEQYLLIRGENKENPVIIWLHGGPSGSDTFTNYVFTKHLEDEYTVVGWDQRGCGRTYYRNKKADPNNETATFDQAQQDLDELVDYVCNRFGK